MAYEPVRLIEVRAWGALVGALVPSTRVRAYSFQYAPEWIATGIELSPALMPLARDQYRYPGLPDNTFHGLPPAIADSLPDAFGNAIIDAWLAREGILASQVTALDRLAYLGERGMGALEFRPENAPSLPPPTALDLGQLVVSARRAVDGSLASENESEAALQRIIEGRHECGRRAGQGHRQRRLVDARDPIGPRAARTRVRAVAPQVRRHRRGRPARAGPELRPHRIRLLAHGRGRGHRDGAHASARGARPRALHDAPLRPLRRRRAPAHADTVRDGRARLPRDRGPRLRAVLHSHHRPRAR